jgi:hypothetical protein
MSLFTPFRAKNCYWKILLFSAYIFLAYVVSALSLDSTGDTAALFARSLSWLFMGIGFLLLFKPRFSHLTWFWFSMTLTYGSWPVLAFTYTTLMPLHPATALVNHNMSDYSMFQANDLLFLFTGVVLISGHKNKAVGSKKI